MGYGLVMPKTGLFLQYDVTQMKESTWKKNCMMSIFTLKIIRMSNLESNLLLRFLTCPNWFSHQYWSIFISAKMLIMNSRRLLYLGCGPSCNEKRTPMTTFDLFNFTDMTKNSSETIFVSVTDNQKNQQLQVMTELMTLKCLLICYT